MPCGERPSTLAGLLPALRSGVLLADIAAAATGEKFVVRTRTFIGVIMIAIHTYAISIIHLGNIDIMNACSVWHVQ